MATQPISQQQPPQEVISVGTLPEMLSLREAVLKAAGFNVLTTTDANVALNKIKKGDCGALLMCYSLSDEWRERLATAFRKHCPNGEVVLISNKAVEVAPFADRVRY
jgi:DNA-binding response OmpR family regulator